MRKSTFLSLFQELAPTLDSRKDVSPDQIVKISDFKFPVERPVSTKSTDISTTGTPGAAAAAQPTKEVIVLNDAGAVRFDYKVGEDAKLDELKCFASVYVSDQGITKENVRLAIEAASTALPKSASFEIFNRNHMDGIEGLIQVLYYMSSENLKEAIASAKKSVNNELLNYCIHVILRHRPDSVSDSIQVPSHITSYPGMYIDVSRINNLLFTRQAAEDEKKGQTMTAPIEILLQHDFTATDADPEHKVAYFREDIGISLHHRHWHEVFPTTAMEAFNLFDRRGELFIYMHGQLLARYNCERLCNGLDPVESFTSFREPIMQAYYPKLDEASEVKAWSPRQPFAKLQNVNRDGIIAKVKDLKCWRNRLIDTIDRGYALQKKKDGTEELVKLDEPKAINDLGNTIDGVRCLSWNANYYGDLHNTGHILIAYCHDPEKRFKEQGGVMGKPEAALKDPIFYRWHSFIDDVIDRYRMKLKPHQSENKLSWEDVQITSVGTEAQDEKTQLKIRNEIKTYWEYNRVDVTEGILNLKQMKETKRPSEVYAKFKHLQHEEFIYKITVENKRKEDIIGVVRIFMAPATDETRQPMKFNKLRRFMIELDKFTYKLKPGKNQIEWKSERSSVTVPFEQTFMNIKSATEYSNNADVLSYCGCGLPYHLLVGRGTKAGFECILFVMITDYDKDKVSDSLINSDGHSAISYCGVRDKKFPDNRPMGFPFDRPIPDNTADLKTFMTRSQHTGGEDTTPFPNMCKTRFKIIFTGEIKNGKTCKTCDLTEKTTIISSEECDRS